jgi:RimJ/RimL family protein N-acetyltransferase
MIFFKSVSSEKIELLPALPTLEIAGFVSEILASELVWYTNIPRIEPSLRKAWALNMLKGVNCNGNELYVVAETASHISVGLAQNVRFNDYSEIGLIIKSPWQRQGIGTQVLKNFQPTMPASGIFFNVARIHNSNTAAIALFEKQGYKRDDSWLLRHSPLRTCGVSPPFGLYVVRADVGGS